MNGCSMFLEEDYLGSWVPDVWHRFEKTLREKFLPNAGWDLFAPSARRGGCSDLGCAPVSPLFRRAGGGRRDVSSSVDSPFPLAAPQFAAMPRVHLSRPLPSTLPSLSYFPSRPLAASWYINCSLTARRSAPPPAPSADLTSSPFDFITPRQIESKERRSLVHNSLEFLGSHSLEERRKMRKTPIVSLFLHLS